MAALNEKEIDQQMIAGIRQGLAIGFTSKQIRGFVLIAQQRSGLKKEQPELVKVYNRHFEFALAQARKMPALEETCQLCGNKAAVCITCSSCGRRVCRDCCKDVRYENRPGYPVLVPAITCKNCSGGGD